ncbi:MAG: hypothetical protein LLF76_14840 [Planctomycetaceae bacterium]|nr:hypothetical protein [Planctomycetaceae bacterium]
MKTWVAVVIASVCLLYSNLWADYPVINICVGVSGEQINPDVFSDANGTIVVWEDARNGAGNLEIYWTDLNDPNLINNRITQTGSQKLPAISQNTIVWQDERISGNREIYVYDLGGEPLAILADSVHQRYPDVSGQTIVCEYYNAGFYNIALWNAVTSSYDLLAPAAATQMHVAVSGNTAVWRDDRNGTGQIYRCDLSVLPYAASPVYASASHQQYPAVSGDIVAWQDVTSNQVTAYDLAKGRVIWTHSVSGVQTNCASMSGDILVWQELRSGGTDYNIRGYDFSTGTYLDIAASNQDDQNPSISGRTVVWQRNGTDIVGAMIPTPVALAVTAPNGGEMFLAGTQIEIAWQMTAGQAPAAVDVEFSAQGGIQGSWIAIAQDVPFDGTFVWDSFADVDSQQCLIRVKDADDALVADVSDAAFTIFQCSPQLTADLTGDCFVGIEDFAQFALQWLACGNPHDQACLSN